MSGKEYNRLLQLRLREGKTQEEFAMEFCISREHYCRVERGKIRPTFKLLREIENKYGTPLIPNAFGDGDCNMEEIWKTLNMFPKETLGHVNSMLKLMLSLTGETAIADKNLIT